MGKPARTGLRLWDRFVLLAAWVVTCGFVYLLGFYTGKGTQERQLGLEERVVRLPVTSQAPAAGQRPKGSSDLTFYEKLVSGGSGEGTAAPAAKPPAPADTPPAAAPAAKATTPPPPPSKPTPSTTVQTPKAAPPSTTVPQATAGLPPPPPTDAPSPTAAVTPRAGGGWWTVTASPTRERAEAEDLMYRLKGRGYPVTLVRVLRDGDTWYRLQVGRYTSAEQANEMMRRLRDQEGVPHAFVASE